VCVCVCVCVCEEEATGKEWTREREREKEREWTSKYMANSGEHSRKCRWECDKMVNEQHSSKPQSQDRHESGQVQRGAGRSGGGPKKTKTKKQKNKVNKP
jgi:hypothetical protein